MRCSLGPRMLWVIQFFSSKSQACRKASSLDANMRETSSLFKRLSK
jgi:hypothetical protein